MGGVPSDGEGGMGTQLAPFKEVARVFMKTDAALLMVQAEEARWVMKADGYLRLEAWVGVMECTVWDLVREETGV
jgi:hypothetical protein